MKLSLDAISFLILFSHSNNSVRKQLALWPEAVRVDWVEALHFINACDRCIKDLNRHKEVTILSLTMLIRKDH